MAKALAEIDSEKQKSQLKSEPTSFKKEVKELEETKSVAD